MTAERAALKRARRKLRQVVILRNGSFGLLWTGQLLSATGTWLLIIAVPVHVLQLTHSVRDTGLAFVAEVIPMVVLGPVAGVFADRWSKRQTMIVTSVLRAPSVLLLIFFNSAGRVWVLLLSVVAENALGVFFTPAYRAVIPLLVGRGRDLGAANAWSTVARGVTGLAGAPLGGALYAALGFRWLVVLDAASYLICAGCVAVLPALRTTAAGTTAAGTTAAGRAAVRRITARWPGGQQQTGRSASSRGQLSGALHGVAVEFRAGVAHLRRDKVLARLAGVTALFLLGNGALTALLVPYISARLHGGATTVGMMLAALGAGYLLSAYPGRKLCACSPLRSTVGGLLAGVVVTFAVFFNTGSRAAALIAIGLAGLPGGAFLMLEQTLMQRLAPDDVIGRICAAYSTIESGATLLGALAASLLVRPLGLSLTVNAAIGAIAVGGLFAALIPRTPAAPVSDSTASRALMGAESGRL